MIRRGQRPDRYTIVPNAIIENSRLDWKELGLLVYLLSKPDHWEVSPAHLVKQRMAGRDAIYSMLTKLRDAGYALHTKHSSGESEWIISENPNPPNPDEAKPNPENPDRAEPDTDNPIQVNTETTDNTDHKQGSNTGYRTKKGHILRGESLEWFEAFWVAFNYKSGKAEASEAWRELWRDGVIDAETTSLVVIPAAEQEASRRQRILDRNGTPKMAEGWLRGRRFEDDHADIQNTKNSEGRLLA